MGLHCEQRWCKERVISVLKILQPGTLQAFDLQHYSVADWDIYTWSQVVVEDLYFQACNV